MAMDARERDANLVPRAFPLKMGRVRVDAMRVLPSRSARPSVPLSLSLRRPPSRINKGARKIDLAWVFVMLTPLTNLNNAS